MTRSSVEALVTSAAANVMALFEPIELQEMVRSAPISSI